MINPYGPQQRSMSGGSRNSVRFGKGSFGCSFPPAKPVPALSRRAVLLLGAVGALLIVLPIFRSAPAAGSDEKPAVRPAPVAAIAKKPAASVANAAAAKTDVAANVSDDRYRLAGNYANPGGYRIEPPDVLDVEITRWPGGKVLLQGWYLVGPDGTINMRKEGVGRPQADSAEAHEAYRKVSVAGLTEREAERQIVKTVSRQESGAEFSARVQVAVFNSKVVYVIFSEKEGNYTRLPVNNCTTVANAILQIDGAAARAAKEPVWLAHPISDADSFKTDVKQIDWQAIVQNGSVAANLPLTPGDRIFIGGRRPEEKAINRPAKSPPE